jgi:Fe-S cluster assembly protein SufD
MPVDGNAGRLRAVPAPKLDGAQALLAAWPEPAGEAGWARVARTRAARRLAERGAPVRRDEYWKFTDPSGLTRLPAPAAAVLAADEKPAFDDVDRVRLVFVDGVFAPELSDAPELAGVEIQPLAAVLATDIHWARELFGQLEARGQAPVDRPLASLNTARATEGAAIRVTGRAEKPVALVYLHRSETSDALIRHLVRLEPGADLTLLETGAGAARLNTVLEVEIGDGAAFHHVRSQGRDHERRTATAVFARLGRESRFKSFTLTVNGRLTRNESVVEFTGDDAMAHVAGACVGDGDFLHDDTVFVTHDAVGCESRQVFKKVLRGGAVGVFQGKILVKPGAQQTDGYQISQGLLLGETSQFLAKPELEIYADDVKCSHGSTSGAVDEDALFYLTSRGIARGTAQELLVLAFVDEAIAEIEDAALADDVRDGLAAWLARRRG